MLHCVLQILFPSTVLLLCNDRQWWSRACPPMTALTARGMTATVTNVVRVARVRTHSLVTRTTDCARLAVTTGSTHPTSAGDTSKVGVCRKRNELRILQVSAQCILRRFCTFDKGYTACDVDNMIVVSAQPTLRI